MVNIYYIYDLPFFRDQESLMGKVLGGWQISGATFFRTGTPFSVMRTERTSPASAIGSIGQPVDLVGDVNGQRQPVSSRRARGDQNFWFNTAAFADPAAGTFGNAPRNLIYNPGEQQWDIALFKNFSLGGIATVQFRAEVFNFLNHPTWQRSTRAEPRRSDQRQLRPHHQQERRSARHPAEPALPVLASRIGGERPVEGFLPRALSLRVSTTLRRMSFRTQALASGDRGRRGHPAGRGTERRAARPPSPRRRRPPAVAPYTETIPGTRVSFDMVPVPGGTFTMGSPASEPFR